MTNYSKRLAKYSKNIKSHTKRRRYIRKNSRRNKKIFYGGTIRTLEFTYNGIDYTLTKKKPFLNLRGAGTYTLANKDSQTLLINAQSLSEFIVAITNPTNKDIIIELYNELARKSTDTTTPFQFKSLYNGLELYKQFGVLNEDKMYNIISIATFHNLVANDDIVVKYINDSNILKTRYTILKKIYDSIPRGLVFAMYDDNAAKKAAEDAQAAKDAQEAKDAKKTIPTYTSRVLPTHAELEITIPIKLTEIYKNFPLSKINPNLPRLITLFPNQLGRGSFGSVYNVSMDGNKYALKVISFRNIDDAVALMGREVIVYNTISQLVCDSDNTLFCKFISAYCDFTAKLIYVLMEYCGNSLHKIMYNNLTSITPTHIYEWLINIAKGLQCMHQSKYAHLDIKPDNIVLDTTLQSKLIDFGIAYNFSGNKNEKLYRGSLSYMSPEMIDNKEITDLTKCDVYSLGITFIECAFAVKYPDTYKNCLSSKASEKLFYFILRYDYSLKLSSPPTEFILSVVTVDRLGKVEITTTTYVAEKVVYTFREISYTLSDLYTNVLAIHTAYPLFQDMIKTNHVDRCSIDDVIRNGNEIIRTLPNGVTHTFEFTFNDINYTLTKKKSLINLHSDVTYTLAKDDFETLMINKRSLSDFISSITTQNNLAIMHALYTKLNKQSMNTNTPFQFESLYEGLKVYYEIYKDLPLSKINPDLPNLINKGNTHLGMGRVGNVYSVTYNQTIHALKVIDVINHDFELLMDREVITYNKISQVCNTNICKFISAYCNFTTKKIYVLMEYYGNNLYNFMSEYQKTNIPVPIITPAHIYKWLINIATGLNCMHLQNYVHLDIKPDNIVLDTTNLVSKLIDFGFAYDSSLHDKHIKQWGTPKYMSPEMIDNKEITDITKCDVYSLGITFIECAFAFQYPGTYKNCLSSEASTSLFYSILRYDYSLKLPSQPTEFILSVVTVDLLGNVKITPITYTGTKVVYNIPVYTLSELYTDLHAIHEEYSLFRDMIKTDPVERVRIDTVISK
jgi:serine/threonine protein kinase